MRGGIVEGLTSTGNALPISADPDGNLGVTQPDATALLSRIADELTAIRRGLEMVLETELI